MAYTVQEFASHYTTALEAYLAGAGEAALGRAYELGREALEYESGVLMVAAAHHEALQTILLRQAGHEKNTPLINEAAGFFLECLSPFEMAQRGFQAAITTLRHLNEVLTSRQRDLHLLLSPMPDLLLTVDERDCLAAFFVPPSFPPILKACEVGLPLADVLPEALNGLIMAALAKVSEPGQTHRLECPLVVDGQTLYFELQISLVSDSHNVLLVIDNITERKEMQLAEHRQRVLAEALRDTALALSSSLDLDEVLNRIVESIGRVVPHDTANIMLVEGHTARIVRSFGHNEHGLREFEEEISKLQLTPHETPTLYKVIESKRSVIVANLESDTDPHVQVGLGQTGSAISAPLLLAGVVVGFINLNSFKPDFFTAVHAENLQTFANQAAVAIQNAHLFERAQTAAAAQERERLARDLHDAVSQTLFAASTIAEALPRQWQQAPEKVVDRLEQLRQLTHGAQAEMRTLLLELRPTALLDADCKSLLLQLADAMRGRKHMDIHVAVDEAEPLLPDVKVNLYRIAQEALNNVVKHARATQAEVRLTAAMGEVELSVLDNGQGFDPKAVASTSLGLGIMHERAAAIGSILSLDTKPGQGTHIRVTWTPAGNNKPIL